MRGGRAVAVLLLSAFLLALSVVVGLAGAGALPVFAQDDTPLTATFLQNTAPAAHDGAGQTFSIRIEFSEPVAVSYKVLRDEALQVDNGTARKFKRVNDSNQLWEVHAEPSSDDAVTLTLPETTDCDASNAVCTADRKPLSAKASVTIPGPASASTPTPTPTPEPTSLTAEFRELPEVHDGDAAFTFKLSFSEEVGMSYRDMRDHVLTVTGGSVTSASRLQQGSNQGWRIVIDPDSQGDVTVALPATTDCDDQGAVCTADREPLSEAVSETVPGPAALVPTGLTAAASDDGVALDWTAPAAGGSSLTGYHIQRADGEGAFSDLAADTASTATTHTDATAQAGQSYRYRVAALRGSERSDWSGEAPVTLEPPPAAGLTVGLLLSGAVGYSEAGGTGSLVPAQVSIEDTEYRVTGVQAWPGQPGLAVQVTGGDADTDRALAQTDWTSLAGEYVLTVDRVEFSLDTALLAHGDTTPSGQEYQGSVAVVWVAGQLSLAVGETVVFGLESRQRPDPARSAPSALAALASEGGVALSWNAPEADVDAVTGYAIERAEGDGDFGELVSDTGSTETTHTDTTPRADRSYRYRVAALRGTDRSGWSGEAQVTLPPETLPTAPRWRVSEEVWSATLTVGLDKYGSTGYSREGYGTLDVTGFSWMGHDLTVERLAIHSGSSGINLNLTTGAWAGDRALAREDHSGSNPVHALLVGERMLFFSQAAVRHYSSIDINGNYTGTVGYKWSVGRPGWSEDDTVSVSLAAVEEVGPAELAPTALGATFEDGTVTLGWSAPARFAGEVTGYRVERSGEGGDFSVLVADTGSTETGHTDATAGAGRSYRYRVAALRDNELSAWSNEASVTLPEPPAGTPPPEVVVHVVEPQWDREPQMAPQQVDNNNPAQGRPVINGTAAVGQTLTVDLSGITDADGRPTDPAAFSYEWIAVLSSLPSPDVSFGAHHAIPYVIHNISGRPYGRSSYTVRQNDVGMAISVRVRFEDLLTNEEEVISERTAVVPNPDVIAAKSFASLHSDNADPEDIWTNGVTMWVLDGDDKKIYAYALRDDPDTTAIEAFGDRVSTKDFTGLSAAGNDKSNLISSDGQTMWVHDFIDNQFFAYAMGDDPDTTMTTEAFGDRVSSKDASQAAGGSLSGMWIDTRRKSVWVYENVTYEALAEIDLSDGTLTGREVIPYHLNALKNDLKGLWSRGSTMWMVNTHQYNRVIAFSKSPDVIRPAGRGKPAFDVYLASTNADPEAITSDGETMWVLDGTSPSGSGDYRIFAYDLPDGSRLDYDDRGLLPIAHVSASPGPDYIDITVEWDRLAWPQEWDDLY